MAEHPRTSLPALSTETRSWLLASVVEQAQNGVLLVVVSTRSGVPLQTVYHNAAFSTITGYPSEEIVSEPLAFLSGPDIDPTAIAQILSAAADHAALSLEMHAYRKDRTPLWVALAVVPVTDTETGSRYLAIVLRDISAHKSQQAASRATAMGLARSNRALEEFASVASHDLQEPLRKIKAFGDLLVEQSAAALDEEGRDYLARMLEAAERMQTLINDLLTLARLTGQIQLFAPVDLNRVVQ